MDSEGTEASYRRRSPGRRVDGRIVTRAITAVERRDGHNYRSKRAIAMRKEGDGRDGRVGGGRSEKGGGGGVL